jgi:hypothetical protein
MGIRNSIRMLYSTFLLSESKAFSKSVTGVLSHYETGKSTHVAASSNTRFDFLYCGYNNSRPLQTEICLDLVL